MTITNYRKHMHKSVRVPHPKDPVGHRERFEDGVYVCEERYGQNRHSAEVAAEELARRYKYKVRLTETKVRVDGEHGTVMKPLYLAWVKVS